MSTTPSTFVTNLYRNVLRRSVAAGTATNAELLGWDNLVSSGVMTQAQVTTAFINSSEAQNFINPVVRSYQTFFNRVPDSGGMDFWAGQARSGMSLESIAANFVGSQEFTTLYGPPTASNVDSFITALYVNVLGRAPDAGGFAYWRGQFSNLGAGFAAASSVANSFANSAEFIETSKPYITNLLTTAASTGSLGSGPLTSTGGTGAGSTFTLTTATDALTGTSGNDTFLADNSGASVTASSVDQINAGFGTDTLKITSANTTALEAVALPSLASVELLQFTGGKMVGTSASLDVSGLIGVTRLIVDSPLAMVNGDKYTLKTTTAQSVTLVKVNGTATLGNNSTVVVNGAPTIILDSVGSTNSTVTVDMASTGAALTLTASGDISDAALAASSVLGSKTAAASKIALTNTGAGLTTLTITGDRNLAVTEAINSITSINASAATGSISVDASGATLPSTFTFKGGTGNDQLTLQAGALSLLASPNQLDGGAGTDVLATSESSVLSSALILGQINKLANFETLGFAASGSGVDVGNLSTFNSFKIMAGNYSETFTNALSTTKFTVDNSLGAGILIIGNRAGEGATTVIVENNGSTSKTFAKLDVAAIATVNLSSINNTGVAGAVNVITDIVNNDNSAIVITGAADLTITNKLVATTLGSKVDASAFTAKLSLVGSVKSDTIIGGTGADTIQAAAAGTLNQADTLTGGAGADTFKFVATGTNSQVNDFASLLKSSAGTAGVVRITDFTAATDKIHLEIDNTAGTLVAGTSVAVATLQTIATAADITAVYAAITPIAASVSGGALSAVQLTVSGGAAAGTYLYVNDATAGVSSTNDMLINLTGISGAISSGDFILA